MATGDVFSQVGGVFSGSPTTTLQHTGNAIQQSAQSAGIIQISSSSLITLMLLVAIGVGMLVWMMMYIYRNNFIPKKWNYEIKLNYLGKDGRPAVRNTKGRVIYDSRDPNIFKVRGGLYKPLTVSIPEDDAIELRTDGRFDLEGVVAENNTVIWLKRTITKEKLGDIDSAIKKIQPITQPQRAFWVSQNRKAERDKTTSIMQFLMILAPIIILIIVLVIVFMYWPKVTEKIVNSQALENENVRLNIKLVDKINVLYKLMNGTELSPYDKTVFNDTEVNRFNNGATG